MPHREISNYADRYFSFADRTFAKPWACCDCAVQRSSKTNCAARAGHFWSGCAH